MLVRLFKKGWIEMRKMIGLLIHTIKVFLLFAGCTILFYYGMMWVSQEYENYRRYDEPEGTAVKVSQSQTNEKYDSFARLMLFYLHGE